MKIFGSKGSVTIDGRTFVGNNIQIDGDNVIVDGVTQSGKLVGPITITVDGDVERIESGSGDITCKNVGKISTGSGDVEVSGDCNGDIKWYQLQVLLMTQKLRHIRQTKGTP